MNFVVKIIDRSLRLFNRTITLLGIRKPVTSLILVLTRVFLTLIHWVYFRMTVRGHSNIPKTGGVIIAANHQSYLDPTLVALAVLRNVTFVSKRENFEVPILGPLIELGDAHPIERGGDDGALDFFEKLLKQGHCITIFPEGTIPAEEDKLRSDVEPETGLLK